MCLGPCILTQSKSSSPSPSPTLQIMLKKFLLIVPYFFLRVDYTNCFLKYRLIMLKRFSHLEISTRIVLSAGTCIQRFFFRMRIEDGDYTLGGVISQQIISMPFIFSYAYINQKVFFCNYFLIYFRLKLKKILDFQS